MTFCTFGRSGAQQIPALMRGVLHVKDKIAQGVDVEPVRFRGEFDAQSTGRSLVLERQVTQVVEIQGEQTGVTLSRRCRDGFGGAMKADDARVVGQGIVAGVAACVVAAAMIGRKDLGVDPDTRPEQRYLAMNTLIRSDDAGESDRQAADT